MLFANPDPKFQDRIRNNEQKFLFQLMAIPFPLKKSLFRTLARGTARKSGFLNPVRGNSEKTAHYNRKWFFTPGRLERNLLVRCTACMVSRVDEGKQRGGGNQMNTVHLNLGLSGLIGLLDYIEGLGQVCIVRWRKQESTR